MNPREAAFLLLLWSFAGMPLLAIGAKVADFNSLKGNHWRLESDHGAIHVWTPRRYLAGSAGVVVYVHGYYTDGDGAWAGHGLAAQFSASRRNAVFIVPEAPASIDEVPFWSELVELLDTVFQRTPLRRPPGPLVVVGHSGAFRTIVPWLGEPSLKHVILLDGLYECADAFHKWLSGGNGHAGNRLTLVTRGTGEWADPLLERVPGAERAGRIPERFGDLTAKQRAARLLDLSSQYGHTEIVTSGKTIPIVLRRTPLPGFLGPL